MKTRNQDKILLLFVIAFLSIITPLTIVEAEYDPKKVNDGITVADPFYKEGWNKVRGKGWILGKEIKIKIRTASGYKTLATTMPNNEGKFEEWVTIAGVKNRWIDAKSKSSHEDSLGLMHILVVQDYGDKGFSAVGEYVELRSGSNPNGGGPSESSSSDTLNLVSLSAQTRKYEKRVNVLNSIYKSSEYVEMSNIFIDFARVQMVEDNIHLFRYRIKKITK